VRKSNCSSQNPLLTTRIWTRDLWFRSLGLRPLNRRFWGYQTVCLRRVEKLNDTGITAGIQLRELSNTCKDLSDQWPCIHMLKLLHDPRSRLRLTVPQLSRPLFYPSFSFRSTHESFLRIMMSYTIHTNFLPFVIHICNNQIELGTPYPIRRKSQLR
jgi:hypothetical protein